MWRGATPVSANMMQFGWRQVLLGQVSIIVFSVAGAFFRQYYGYIILAYFVIFFVVSSRLSKRSISGKKVDLEEFQKAKKFFEEKNAREIMMEDPGLANDMGEQMKIMKVMMLPSIVTMLYYFLLWSRLPAFGDSLSTQLNDQVTGHFLAFFLFFEGGFVISWIGRLIMMRRTDRLVTFNMPTQYTVTDKGILIGGVLGSRPLPFPLEGDIKLNMDEKRKFVEIESASGKNVMKLRFYTRTPKRLYDIIERYGLRKRESKKGS